MIDWTTDEGRKRLRALLLSATPRPWWIANRVDGREIDGGECPQSPSPLVADRQGMNTAQCVAREDAALIVAAVNALTPLLDALEEAEARRDDALADYARVLAEKRAVEVVAQHFGWDGQTALDVWVIVQARMAREERTTVEWIETAAHAFGYDPEGDDALPEWIERICRERDAMRAALLHVETLGFHVENCYAHVEHEPDDVEPRCAPECPTATAQRALDDGKAQP